MIRIEFPGMKKLIIAASAAAAVGIAGYGSKNFIRDNYMPIRSGLAQSGLLGYKKTSCPKGGIIIALFGQSNSANSVKPFSTTKAPDNLYQYDWISKQCFEYREPLLGAQGLAGNAITYTAKKIANGTSKPVLIVPFGLGGTSVLQWAHGFAANQHELALKNMKAAAISPNIFLWHQGESDIGISKDKYLKALKIVLTRTKKYYPNSYFGIALASRCRTTPWEPTRQAQSEVAKNNEKTFISADSDKIYSREARYDKCHFSDRGAKELGSQYYSSVSELLK